MERSTSRMMAISPDLRQAATSGRDVHARRGRDAQFQQWGRPVERRRAADGQQCRCHLWRCGGHLGAWNDDRNDCQQRAHCGPHWRALADWRCRAHQYGHDHRHGRHGGIHRGKQQQPHSGHGLGAQWQCGGNDRRHRQRACTARHRHRRQQLQRLRKPHDVGRRLVVERPGRADWRRAGHAHGAKRHLDGGRAANLQRRDQHQRRLSARA